MNLSRSEKRILFARAWQHAARHLRCECEQIIGGVTHRRDHGNNALPRGAIRRDAGCNGADPLHVGNRAPAVLLDEEIGRAHLPNPVKASIRTPS